MFDGALGYIKKLLIWLGIMVEYNIAPKNIIKWDIKCSDRPGDRYSKIMYGYYKDNTDQSLWGIIIRWSIVDSWEAFRIPISKTSGNLEMTKRKKITLDRYYLRYEIYEVKKYIDSII